METKVFLLHTPEETEKFGKLLGKHAEKSDVICLDGDLGAGKTTLSQAVARGLGVPDSSYVTSPSFAIMHEYEGRLMMYHMDFYRLEDELEVEDLGFSEYFYKDGLTVIEWSKRGGDILPDDRLTIQLTLLDESTRRASCTYSNRYRKYIEALAQEFTPEST